MQDIRILEDLNYKLPLPKLNNALDVPCKRLKIVLYSPDEHKKLIKKYNLNLLNKYNQREEELRMKCNELEVLKVEMNEKNEEYR